MQIVRCRVSVMALTLLSSAAGPLRAQQTPPKALPLNEIVVSVTRTDRQVRELPANVTVLTRESIQLSAARTLPDLLRSIPGFTLSDYQSSIAANPARQSPAMRGLGGTTSSRVLVLVDGVPMDDPFTGWVAWSRVPLDLVERVEIVRGGGAGIWGNRAMGGVINIITVNAADNRTQVTLRGGSQSTQGVNGAMTRVAGRFSVTAAGEYFSTQGFYVVPAHTRGPIDARSGLHHKVGFARVRYDVSQNLSFHVNADWFDEHRRNATQMRYIDTEIGKLHAGGKLRAGENRFSVDVFGVKKAGDQLSTSEAADRTSETPTLGQFDVPSEAFGLNLQWSRALFGAHDLTAGADLLYAAGELNEDIRWLNGAFTRRRNAAGEQVDRSVYLQDVWMPAESWRILLAGRFDRWTNRDGLRSELDIPTGNMLVDTTYPARNESRLSYTLAVRHDASARAAWRASVYSAFRAPTLNELYRPARVSGNILLEADPSLRAERLNGAELGLDYAAGAAVLLRTTAFWSRLENPIVEVTVGEAVGGTRNIPPCGSVPAGGACRQRRNLGASRSFGLETELELRPYEVWSFAVSHVWNPTEITSAPGQQVLVGKTLVGHAEHVFTGRARYAAPRLADIALTGRYVGRRYDDDQNRLVLDPFFVVEARVARAISAHLDVFGAVENLFDHEYAINRAFDGSFRIAAPRRFETGVKAKW